MSSSTPAATQTPAEPKAEIVMQEIKTESTLTEEKALKLLDLWENAWLNQEQSLIINDDTKTCEYSYCFDSDQWQI